MTKRLMIYFFYDKDGIADDYIPYFLQSFKPFCEEICVVVNGLLTDDSKKKLEKVSNKILIRENKGLDVEAYKHGLFHYGFENVKNNFDEVIITNFTLFGPFLPLDNMFKNIEEQNCDWWAPFKWYIETDDFRHIPSFFNVYKKSLISSPHFEKYWNNLPEIVTYADSCAKHEQKQTKHWQSLGFKEGVWIDDAKYKDYWKLHWPLICADKLILDDSYPFIKRRSLYVENFINNQEKILSNLLSFLNQENSYPKELIIDNLVRTQNLEIKRFNIKLLKAFLLYKIHPSKKKRIKYQEKIKTFYNEKSYKMYLKDLNKKIK